MNTLFSFLKANNTCFERKQEDLEKIELSYADKTHIPVTEIPQNGYEDSRWIEKSNFIKARDNHTCQLCHRFNPSANPFVFVKQGEYETIHRYYWSGTSSYEIQVRGYMLKICFDLSPGYYIIMPKLNVHHKVYYKNRSLWDYQDYELVTLCEKCHHYIHSLNDIGIPIIENNIDGRSTLIGKTSPKAYNPKIDHTDLSTFEPFSIVKENLYGYGLHGDDLNKFNQSQKQGKKWYEYQEVLDNDVLQIGILSFENMSKKSHEETKCVAEFIINDFINNILGYKTIN